LDLEKPPVKDTALDHGIDESFPASDPVSVSITRIDKPAPSKPAPHS